MEKLKIIIVRHGQSVANKNKVIVGRTDALLTLKGKMQAKKVAKRLEKEYVIDKVYSSPLKRAYNTAKEIAKKQKLEKIYVKDGITELYFGELENVKESVCKEKYKGLYNLWRNVNKYPSGFKNQESIEEVICRYKKEMDEIIKESSNLNTICIVSHSLAINSYITYLKGYSKDKFKDLKHLDNTGIYVLEYDRKKDKIEIVVSADAKHL